MNPNVDEIISRFEQEARELDIEEAKKVPQIINAGMTFDGLYAGQAFLYPSVASTKYNRTKPNTARYVKFNVAYATDENDGSTYFPGYSLVDLIEDV